MEAGGVRLCVCVVVFVYMTKCRKDQEGEGEGEIKRAPRPLWSIRFLKSDGDGFSGAQFASLHFLHSSRDPWP